MEGFLIGGLSGCAATFLLYPIETIKSQSQMRGELMKPSTGSSSFRVAYNLFHAHGIGRLYHGLSYSMARQMTYTSLRIGSYNYGMAAIQKTKYDNVGAKLGIGLMAGISSSLIAAPLDRVIVQHQVGKFQTVRRFSALWKGASTTVLRASVINSTSLTVNNMMNELSKTWIDRLVASTAAGVVAATVSLPFDMVRTRIMADTDKKYNGAVDCAKKILKYEGVAGFWKGYPMYLGRVGTQSSIILFLSETLFSYIK